MPVKMRLIICLIFFLVFAGCEEEKAQPQKVQEIKRTYKGDVELLNSCGMPGAAAKMKVYLRDNGFDVVSTRNDIVQNYEQTVLVLRNPEWEGAQALAKALKTDNVMTVISKRALVDASVYIGKDLNQIVEPEQGE